MDITHYYLHTCFNFVLINTGLICMRINYSLSDTKSLKTILEQKDILRFELRTQHL